MKDAFYFPHFCNARKDRKLRRVIKELGVEGYGIYFMVLEVLREEKDFRYPLEDLDLLADEFGTTEAKLRTVICNYKLFQVDEEQNFFSIKFIEYLTPYLEAKQKKRIAGIKGNLIKYGYITKEEANKLTNIQIIELNENKELLQLSHSESHPSRTASQRKEKERKEKEIKGNENKKNKTIDFEIFWGKYKKDIGKKECRDYFIELNYADIEKIIKTVDQYVLVNEDKQFRKNPINYLKCECWNDEVITEEKEKINTEKLTEKEKLELLENYNLGG